MHSVCNGVSVNSNPPRPHCACSHYFICLCTQCTQCLNGSEIRSATCILRWVFINLKTRSHSRNFGGRHYHLSPSPGHPSIYRIIQHSRYEGKAPILSSRCLQKNPSLTSKLICTLTCRQTGSTLIKARLQVYHCQGVMVETSNCTPSLLIVFSQ